MIPSIGQQTEKQKDKVIGSRVLNAWFSTFKNVKLYKPEHPSSKEAARKLAQLLNSEVFIEKIDMPIYNTDGLFVINDILFIEESLSYYDLLHSLEEHNIPSVTFGPGITEDEIINCSDYLLKKRLPGMPDSGFYSDHLRANTKDKSSEITNNKPKLSSQSYHRILDLYITWVTITEQVFSKLLDDQNISLSDLNDPLEKILDELHQNPASFSSMVTTIPLTNLHVQHSLHTMIYSMFIGQQLNLDPSNLKILGIAALLHDIGRLFLPADFTTGYRLQPGDIDFVQLHTRDGASYLAGVTGLPMSIVRIALEHHVGFDGKGYPALPEHQKPRFFSQIIGLTDFASWATVSKNFYHKPIPLHRLIRTLVARAGTQFDPLLVKLFVPFLGLYPPGTYVKLSSGETGVVIEPNLRNIGRPLVATKTPNGTFQTQWLTTLSKEEIPHPYQRSITGIIGRIPSFEPYTDLLSNTSNVKN